MFGAAVSHMVTVLLQVVASTNRAQVAMVVEPHITWSLDLDDVINLLYRGVPTIQEADRAPGVALSPPLAELRPAIATVPGGLAGPWVPGAVDSPARPARSRWC